MLVNLMRTVNEIWTSSLEIDKNVSYIFDLFIYLFVCLYLYIFVDLFTSMDPFFAQRFIAR